MVQGKSTNCKNAYDYLGRSEYEIVENNKTDLSTRTVYLPDYVCGLLRERQQKSESDFITEVLPNRFWEKFSCYKNYYC